MQKQFGILNIFPCEHDISSKLVNFTDEYETNVSYEPISNVGIPARQVVLLGYLVLNGTFIYRDTKKQLILCECHIKARSVERQKVENYII